MSAFLVLARMVVRYPAMLRCSALMGAVALWFKYRPAKPTAAPPQWTATISIAMAAESLIEEASRRLAEAVPDARVILFGSHARGDAGPDSDLDLLVIEPELENRRAEFVRLRKQLRGLGVAVDLVLVSDQHVEEWGHFEGTMLNDALTEGRVLAEA